MSDPSSDDWRDPVTGKINQKEFWYRFRSIFAVGLSLIILLGGGVFVFSKANAAWTEYRTTEDYLGPGGPMVVVTIPKGSSVNQIGQILVDADVVKSAKAFVRAAAASDAIQAGKYNLRTQIPAKEAVAMLLDKNSVVRNKMVLRDGRTLAQQFQVMSQATGIPVAEFNAAAKNWKALGLPIWAQNGLEGFLYPDTYEVPDKLTASSVIKLVTKQFSDVSTDLNFATESAKMGLTPYQTLTLASIIEKEAGPREEDRAKIARVFYNRLHTKMALGSDATVAYGLGITGRVFTTPAERKKKTPWNTYLLPALPKGPITSPSRKSMEAALHPADGPWTYFRVVNLDTGETLFATSQAEHDQNGKVFDRWCAASPANHAKCK